MQLRVCHSVEVLHDVGQEGAILQQGRCLVSGELQQDVQCCRHSSGKMRSQVHVKRPKDLLRFEGKSLEDWRTEIQKSKSIVIL